MMKQVDFTGYPVNYSEKFDNYDPNILDVDFTEHKESKFNIAEKSLAVLTILLVLTCVQVPILSFIHDMGSLIFVLWLLAFTCASSEWCRD